jgi:uncharacterized protein (TIGR03435 family)
MHIYRLVSCALLGSAFGIVVVAQSPESQTNFEVASMKANVGHPPMKCSGGPDTSDSGRFTCSNAPLAMLLNLAYNNQFYQLKGQPWMYTEGYDISAIVPSETTRAQMRIMLQHLVAERLHVVVHHEPRDAASFSLTVAKGGPNSTALRLTPPSVDPSQTPASDRAMLTTVVGGHWRLTARKQTMKNLAGYLSVRLASEVTDTTGLNGEFDFTIDFNPEQNPSGGQLSTPADGAAPDILESLQDQLGLKLESKHRQMDFLIVDSAARVPSEN